MKCVKLQRDKRNMNWRLRLRKRYWGDYMNFDRIDENLEMIIKNINYTYYCIKNSKLCIGEMEAISKNYSELLNYVEI